MFSVAETSEMLVAFSVLTFGSSLMTTPPPPRPLTVGVGVTVSDGVDVFVAVMFFPAVAFHEIAAGIVSTAPGGTSLLNVMIPADTAS
jgi:hypothetical protein